MTLIELPVVLGIIAVLMAIRMFVVTRFSGS